MLLNFLTEYWWVLLIAILLGGFYLVMHHNSSLQKEYTDKWNELGEKVKPGSEVTLDSGIHGIVREILDKTYKVEIARNVIIEIEKYGVVFVKEKEQV